MKWSAAATLVALVGITRVADAQCNSELDCRDGRICQAGACVYPRDASCNVDVDCPEDYLCQSRKCTPMSAPGGPPPKPPEPEYETVTTGLVLPMTGLGIFGASWIATIITAAATKPDHIGSEAIGYAAIPGAGPAVMSTKYEFGGLGVVGVISSMMGQTIGLGLFLYGIPQIGSKRVPVDQGSLELVPAPSGLGLRWTTGAF